MVDTCSQDQFIVSGHLVFIAPKSHQSCERDPPMPGAAPTSAAAVAPKRSFGYAPKGAASSSAKHLSEMTEDELQRSSTTSITRRGSIEERMNSVYRMSADERQKGSVRVSSVEVSESSPALPDDNSKLNLDPAPLPEPTPGASSLLGAVSDAIVNSARSITGGGSSSGGKGGRVSFGGTTTIVEPKKTSAPGSSEELQEFASHVNDEIEGFRNEMERLTQQVADMHENQERLILKQESMQRELHDTRLQLSKLQSGGGGCFGACFSGCSGNHTIDANLEAGPDTKTITY